MHDLSQAEPHRNSNGGSASVLPALIVADEPPVLPVVVAETLPEVLMRDRVDLWKRIYDTDDNAITKALSRLAWDLTAFTCLVEMVRRAPESEDGGKRLNGMAPEMLGSGFWGSTLLGIRRLAERGPIHGSKGVCSLRGLIQDAKEVRHRLTRRVFVEDIAGLEYDYAATEARYWQFLQSQPSGQAVWVPREYHYEQSKRRHEVFDWLSGTTS